MTNVWEAETFNKNNFALLRALGKENYNKDITQF